MEILDKLGALPVIVSKHTEALGLDFVAIEFIRLTSLHALDFLMNCPNSTLA